MDSTNYYRMDKLGLDYTAENAELADRVFDRKQCLEAFRELEELQKVASINKLEKLKQLRKAMVVVLALLEEVNDAD